MNLISVPASIFGNEIALRIGRRRWILIAMAGSGVTGMLVGLSAPWHWALVLALLVVYSMLVMAESATLTAGLVAAAPAELRGAAMGLYSLVGFGGGMLGPVLFGAALDAAGGAAARRRLGRRPTPPSAPAACSAPLVGRMNANKTHVASRRRSMDRIWLKSYPPGVPADIDPSEYKSLVELFETSIRKYADRPAFPNMGKTISFAELDAQSRDFGAWLQAKGLAKGARVAIMMPNCLQYPVAMFGTLRAGCTVVNVNPLYTPRELEHQLKDSGAEAIVILENFGHVLQEVRAQDAGQARRRHLAGRDARR